MKTELSKNQEKIASDQGQNSVLIEINQENLKSLIYTFRGQQVMLDADLAAIYGYSTKAFNLQVKNNFERFDEEIFMFQLNEAEVESLRFKISTSNDDDVLKSKNLTSKRGGRRYAPYAFTEQGIYMLMTVLKGPLAVQQSKILVKLFKEMKDFIVQNQPLLGQREFLQLSMQTTENVRDIMKIRGSLSEIDDKVAKLADQMGEVVTHSELSNIMLDFGNPMVRRSWLILNGQPVESDLAYRQIYAMAKRSIYMIDNFVDLKSLLLLSEIAEGVEVTVISDNVKHKLHRFEYEDFTSEYSAIKTTLLDGCGIFHDRYIVLDYNTSDEIMYHCGASSKDGGNKVMTINIVEDAEVYHPLIDRTLTNPELVLK